MMNKEAILIKKNKDNKLYDSSIKRYIRLSDILKYVEKGFIIRVIDFQNKDITEEILFAVIFYQRKSLKSDYEVLVDFIKNGLKWIK